jgi:hypothetical protein
MTTKKFLVGIYDDEDEVLEAVHDVRGAGVKILDVYSPFPVHGLDVAIGHPRTRIPVVAFMFGCLGLASVASLVVYTMGVDWPMNIGGKDFLALPDFVPVTFEGTVLFTAYGMTITFFWVNSLYPGKKPIMFDIRTTDDKFAMAIDLEKNSQSEEEIAEILRLSGAVEVNTKIFEV